MNAEMSINGPYPEPGYLVHTPRPCFLNVCFNTALKFRLPFRFSDSNLICVSRLAYVHYMSRSFPL